jgi:hypothetical protein
MGGVQGSCFVKLTQNSPKSPQAGTDGGKKFRYTHS